MSYMQYFFLLQILLFYIVHHQDILMVLKYSRQYNTQQYKLCFYQKIQKNLWKYQKLQETKLAPIKIIQYNTGEQHRIIAKKNTTSVIKKISINLKYCLYEKNTTLYPIYIAYIQLIKQDKTLFQGWIFSQLSSITLPNDDGYFFFVTNNIQSIK